jgi:hypothetical protein
MNGSGKDDAEVVAYEEQSGDIVLGGCADVVYPFGNVAGEVDIRCGAYLRQILCVGKQQDKTAIVAVNVAVCAVILVQKINAVLQVVEYFFRHFRSMVLKSLSCAEFKNHGNILLNKIAMGTVAPMASEE